jgi:hypothetical protein
MVKSVQLCPLAGDKFIEIDAQVEFLATARGQSRVW